jgi:ATP-dependent Clp protease ATP-binding subunit ClpC
MPTFFFPLTVLTQVYEDESALSEALGFEEVSRFDTSDDRRSLAVRVNVEEILKRADALDLNTRISPPAFETKEIVLAINPPRNAKHWREPVEIRFHYLEWQREDGYCQAFVPALGIAAVSKEAAEFENKIEAEICAALARSGAATSLKELKLLERVREIKIEKAEMAVTLKTPKQRAIDEEKEDEEKSVLEQVGEKMNDAKLSPAYEIGEYVEILVEVLKAKQRNSVLLVGASGVGKTAVLRELVRQRDKYGFKDVPFWTTSGARIVAGQTGFGMWQERCQKLVAEAKKQSAIVHLGNLVELLEVGKSVSNSQGIASFFRPKIARGELQTVVECTPEQLAVIEKRDANLLGAFQQIRIEEPDKQTGLKILQSAAQEWSKDKLSATALEAIKTLDAVHRRYATYSAFPGRPVRFLRNLLETQQEADKMLALQSSKVLQAFSEETGLPLFLLSDAEKLDLAKTEKWFESKVLGQSEAVGLIVDLIATVKAKMTKPRKPIASLLFIGATGVGKTELTKALAEFFFSDRERLVRFDMSEFSTQLAVARLIGGAGEAEGQLTAKMREQPFSVVLFDEFEKAHPQFFDLLLQILGEGRLTDSNGRVADFTNSIIVMTSNLGATTFGRGKSGFLTNAKEKRAAVQHFNAAVREFLRPEIFNRLDRIVPFAPLDEKTALKITELEIEKLKRREGLNFRQIKLNIEPEVLKYLANVGYDVRYGARPLRRALERELAAPLSSELNQRGADEKLTVNVRLNGGSPPLFFEIESDAAQKRRTKVEYLLASLATRAAVLRRKSQRLQASYHLTELEDERFQLVKMKERNERGRWVSPEDLARLERLPQIQKFLASAKSIGEGLAHLEDRILLDIYGKAENADSSFADELAINELRLDKVLRELLALKFEKPHEICVEIYGENAAALFRLARAFLVSVENFGGEAVEAMVYTSAPQVDEARVTQVLKENGKIVAENQVYLFARDIWRQTIEKPEEFFAQPVKEVVGVLLRLKCELANPRFASESGLHSFIFSGQINGVLAASGDYDFAKHFPPMELAARNSVANQLKRRVYDADNSKIQDFALSKDFEFNGKNISETVSEAIEANLKQICDRLIG